MSPRESPIWAISCHFNTSDSPRRVHNFRKFRKRLGIPLLAIELSFEQEFELGQADAEILLRRSAEDLLWHKERLLNIAIEAVPETCEAIAWIDADVLFLDELWHEKALSALETTPLLQPYARYHDLPDEGHRLEDALSGGPSLAADLEQMGVEGFPFCDLGARERDGGFSAGLAWVARADLLKRHLLYDAFVLGSADRAMAFAALGRHEDVRETYRLNEARFAHYLRWARPFHCATGGRIGYVPGDLLHLWHGKLEGRKYEQRAIDFAGFDFDPKVDIKLDGSGCWRWSSDKPAMHRYLLDYFHERGM